MKSQGLEPQGALLLPDVRVPPPGPRSREWAARLAACESPAFEARRKQRAERAEAPSSAIVYASGHGALVSDVDGNRYVDLTAGFGSLLLGYPPHAASRAAAEAMATLPLALGDVYGSEVKVLACEAIAKLGPWPKARVMFGTSGADAVTCALKTAMLHTGKPGVVAFEGAYHGLSHGPLSVCGFAPSFREPFEAQLGVPVTFAPYPSETRPSSDLDRSLSAAAAALRSGDVGCVLVEPLLGRGGCLAPHPGFLEGLRELTRAHGALLVCDEIWTGMGRTGEMLASRDVSPDVICLGKGLGSGVAVSACVGREEVMEAWGKAGGATVHTGTHFGAPPACASALATLEELHRCDLPRRAAVLGARLRADLAERAPALRVTGRGLMVGIELGDDRTALRTSRLLLERGFVVLTGGARGSALTLSPPLVVEEVQLDAFAAAVGDVLADANRE